LYSLSIVDSQILIWLGSFDRALSSWEREGFADSSLSFIALGE
jgi:hypothetical protein